MKDVSEKYFIEWTCKLTPHPSETNPKTKFSGVFIKWFTGKVQRATWIRKNKYGGMKIVRIGTVQVVEEKK